MRFFTELSTLSADAYKDILQFFFSVCDKLNIYFPTDSTDALTAYKNSFLHAIDIHELEDEFSALEPKEGFTMVISSLTPAVFDHLLQIQSADFHLSYGLIAKDDVVVYVDEEGGLIIESEDPQITAHPLLSSFKQI